MDDLESPSIRWLLLETPRPEEAVIAALRLHLLRGGGRGEGINGGGRVPHARVDLFGSLEPPEQRAVRNMLLNRAETVCLSQGCQKIVFDIPNWSEDRQNWLSGCGYSDLGQEYLRCIYIPLHVWSENTHHNDVLLTGGHSWPEDRLEEVTRHTMVLQFEVKEGGGRGRGRGSRMWQRMN